MDVVKLETVRKNTAKQDRQETKKVKLQTTEGLDDLLKILRNPENQMTTHEQNEKNEQRDQQLEERLKKLTDPTYNEKKKRQEAVAKLEEDLEDNEMAERLQRLNAGKPKEVLDPVLLAEIKNAERKLEQEISNEPGLEVDNIVQQNQTHIEEVEQFVEKLTPEAQLAVESALKLADKKEKETLKGEISKDILAFMQSIQQQLVGQAEANKSLQEGMKKLEAEVDRCNVKVASYENGINVAERAGLRLLGEESWKVYFQQLAKGGIKSAMWGVVKAPFKFAKVFFFQPAWDGFNFWIGRHLYLLYATVMMLVMTVFLLCLFHYLNIHCPVIIETMTSCFAVLNASLRETWGWGAKFIGENGGEIITKAYNWTSGYVGMGWAALLNLGSQMLAMMQKYIIDTIKASFTNIIPSLPSLPSFGWWMGKKRGRKTKKSAKSSKTTKKSAKKSLKKTKKSVKTTKKSAKTTKKSAKTTVKTTAKKSLKKSPQTKKIIRKSLKRK
jgi:hypothetical protein